MYTLSPEPRQSQALFRFAMLLTWPWLLVAMLLVGGCGTHAAHDDGAIVLKHATAVIRPDGHDIPPTTRDITLPFSWDRKVGGVDGSATLSLTFASQWPGAHLAITTRLGNAYAVRLNGTLIETRGVPGGRYQDTGKAPRLIELPEAMLRGENRLDITIYALSTLNGGLTPVVVGPVNAVRARYVAEYNYRIDGQMIVASISTFLGLFAILIWVRERERLYLVYGAGELLWAFQLFDALMEFPPVPSPWWNIAIHTTYSLAPALICRFTLLVATIENSRLLGALRAYLLLSLPVAIMIAFARLPWLWSVWQGVLVVLTTWTTALLVYYGFRSPQTERRVLAGVALLTAAVALRDLIVIRVLPSFGVIAWSRYCWVAFGLMLAWMLAERLRRASLSLKSMNSTLAVRLAERDAELQLAFRHQLEAERREAITQERLRMTRDMHDGLGSQLLGALHLARNPDVPRQTLADQLLESLDHLKLTVDAMQDTEGDIASLLGGLRYRIGPRLAAAGIAFDWDVAPLPPVPGWTLSQSRDLQMILYEALSNVMQHSGATRVGLQAGWDAQAQRIEIALVDNGRGFDTADTSPGHGTANMRLRARQLGATLAIDAPPDGTRVTLTLPIAGAAPVLHAVHGESPLPEAR